MGYEYGDELVTSALALVDYVDGVRKPGDRLHVEVKLKNDVIHKLNYGTSDVILVQGRHLRVVDFKNGRYPVEAVSNWQMINYAALAVEHYGWNAFDKITMAIVQPNAYHLEGTVREWSVSINKLAALTQELHIGALTALKHDAELRTGAECHFCPAKMICPKQAELVTKAVGTDLNKLPAPQTLPADRIAQVLDAKKSVTNWFETVEKYAYDFVSRGGKIPGYKTVPSRGTRVWVDAGQTEEDAALEGFEDFVEVKLKSPAQMEKVTGKKWVEARTTMVSGGLTLVKDNDSRPSTTKAALDFDKCESVTLEELENGNEKSSKKEKRTLARNKGQHQKGGTKEAIGKKVGRQKSGEEKSSKGPSKKTNGTSRW